MRKITKTSKGWVKVRPEDWEKMWSLIKASSAAERGGDGCDGFCDVACEDNDGCDLSFGGPGDCGALCNNGEVFLEV